MGRHRLIRELSPGDRVGRYVVEELLGRGGMGAVYRAYDEVLRRKVALKLVQAEGAPGGEARAMARRVLREARMAAAFDHPNVVAVFDVGEHEGTPFLVMEHIIGRSLRSLVGSREVDPARAVGWLAAIARALAAAHRAGLVHRDVKPENVMVRDDGAIKVLDFGIAGPAAGVVARRPMDSAPPPSSRAGRTFSTLERGVVAGTPAYMAPELVNEGIFDARTDQFAWGVLAFELLSGRHPWPCTGGVAEMLDVMSADDAAPLDPASTGAPASLCAVVARALERSPDRRFASMDELLAALGEGTERVPLHVSIAPRDADAAGVDLAPTLEATASTRRGAPPEAARAPWRRFAIAFAAGAAIAAAGGAWLVRRHAPPAFEIRSARRLPFGSTYGEHPSFSRDGKLLIYDSSDSGENQVHLVDIATLQRRQLTKGAGWHFAPALSPSGKQYLYISEGSVFLAEIGGGEPRRIAPGAVRPAWTRDGAAFWAGAEEHPARFDAKTLEPIRTIAPIEGKNYNSVLELDDGSIVARAIDSAHRASGIVLHPAGGAPPRWLWKGAGTEALAMIPGVTDWVLAGRLGDTAVAELWQIPLGRGEPRRVGGADVVPIGRLAISPGADRIAWSTATTRGVIGGLEPDPNDPSRLVLRTIGDRHQWHDDDLQAVGTSGLVVALSDRQGTELRAWVLDPSQRVPARMLPIEGRLESSPVASPDGSWLVYAVVGEGVRLMRTDGSGAPRVLTRDPGDDAPIFAADGRSIYFERGLGDKVSILRVPLEGGAAEPVAGPRACSPAPLPSGDALVVLAGTRESVARPEMLDLATGARRTFAGVPESRYYSVRVSPDGRRFALFGGRETLELDIASGKVVHRFDVGVDELTGVAYGPNGLLASVRLWDGDIWIAEGRFR